jgi:hypothetical protein
VEALLTAPGSSHELETRLIDGRVQRTYKNQWPSLRTFWLWAASEHKDATYLVYQDRRYTFSQVNERAAKAASVFRHVYGVRKGTSEPPFQSLPALTHTMIFALPFRGPYRDLREELPGVYGRLLGLTPDRCHNSVIECVGASSFLHIPF